MFEKEQKKLRDKYNQERNVADRKKEVLINEEMKFNQEWAKMKKKLIIEITDEVSAVNQSV